MTRKNLWFVALVVVLMAVLVAGCTQTAAPAATATKAPAAGGSAGGGAGNGQGLFTTNCNSCHPGGDKGVGPSVKNTALTVDQIKAQVRNGKGTMPAFSAAQISDAQLDTLAGYVKTLK